jgi:hypothetical protein
VEERRGASVDTRDWLVALLWMIGYLVSLIASKFDLLDDWVPRAYVGSSIVWMGGRVMFQPDRVHRRARSVAARGGRPGPTDSWLARQPLSILRGVGIVLVLIGVLFLVGSIWLGAGLALGLLAVGMLTTKTPGEPNQPPSIK